MAARGGRRINLADLADDPPLAGVRVPSFAEPAPRSARVEQVAPNPRNTRDVHAHPEKIATLAESIRVHGQLQPSTVVTREAFLAVFPEHAADIGDAAFVQVTGSRRRAAILALGLPTIDIVVKNSLADSRASFVSATAAENIEREEYDPIEEARAIHALTEECGSQKAAAEQLSRTPAWVTQRLNLLKLEPELHAALRSAEIPLREVRDLHKRSRTDQLEALAQWRLVTQQRQRADEKRHSAYDSGIDSDGTGGDGTGGDGTGGDGAATTRRAPRRSPIAAALHRLGGDPITIAETLRSELSPEDRRLLAEELMRE